VAAGLALVVSGCVSTPEVQLSAREVHGRVVLVSPEDRIAVVRVLAGGGPGGAEVVARDAATLQPTARLVATRGRSGNYTSFLVREGLPQVGDEVVAADAEAGTPAGAPAEAPAPSGGAVPGSTEVKPDGPEAVSPQ
jgi:hypothetical protein